MKRLLSIVGGFVLFAVVLLAGLIGYAAYRGPGLDASSKHYIETNLPVILSSWSKEELLKRASPELLKVIAASPPGEIDQLFRKMSKLGTLLNLSDIKGESNMSYTTWNGKLITAAYTATAKFSHGKGQIRVRLIQRDDQWKIMHFYVDSPIFFQ